MVSGESTAQVLDEAGVEDVLAQAEEIEASGDAGAESHAHDGHDLPTAKGGRAKNVDFDKKPSYNIIAVVGGSLPSESAKFLGNTPSVAARKAARRIWKKGGSTDFSVIMRKKSKVTVGRTLYKYRAEVRERTEPIAFFAGKASKFKNADGTVSRDVTKRIHITANPDLPFYGHVTCDGDLVEGERGDDGDDDATTLYRPSGTNTLVLGICKDQDIPKKVAKYNVIRDDHVIAITKENISDEEAAKYDVAGAAKQASVDAAQAQKEKEKARRAKERADAAAAKNSEKSKRQQASSKGGMKGGASADADPRPTSIANAVSITPGPTQSMSTPNRTTVRREDGSNVQSESVLTFSQ